ncbi:unnamed protein product, partial [Polarella glacialis]
DGTMMPMAPNHHMLSLLTGAGITKNAAVDHWCHNLQLPRTSTSIAEAPPMLQPSGNLWNSTRGVLASTFYSVRSVCRYWTMQMAPNPAPMTAQCEGSSSRMADGAQGQPELNQDRTYLGNLAPSFYQSPRFRRGLDEHDSGPSFLAPPVLRGRSLVLQNVLLLFPSASYGHRIYFSIACVGYNLHCDVTIKSGVRCDAPLRAKAKAGLVRMWCQLVPLRW